MKTITYDHFIENPDLAVEEAVLVTREEGRPFVALSQEEYASLDATAFLTRSPENARRLRESIRQAEEGKLIYKTMEELEARAE